MEMVSVLEILRLDKETVGVLCPGDIQNVPPSFHVVFFTLYQWLYFLY